ncbi:SH3 domain-containing protein [Novosphingobium sp. FKTRR1]|uniref:SH3 domain-containing protein n=1 Tax=Novosphingobium sp. FKTRR1 TaxID=2879118 RepID=UPI001CF05981|nr:SH3 domain-containing protein [Novosphingobium sp. FKTRR1]
MDDALNSGRDAGKRANLMLSTSGPAPFENDLIVGSADTPRDFALTRPAEPVDPLHRPVRGDLAHIRCAGHVFVPHYAVPMPHVVLAGGAPLRKAGRADAEVLTELAEGAVFNVLDMAGEWAWGQQGEVGFVGYVPLSALVAA